MFNFAKHYTAVSNGTMSDCADAIEAVRTAMPQSDYIARSLRDNGIPINEIYDLQSKAELLKHACDRALALYDQQRAAAIEAHRKA